MSDRYEVHENTVKKWTVKATRPRKADAVRVAVKLAKQCDDPDISFGVFDTKKQHYIGFARPPVFFSGGSS